MTDLILEPTPKAALHRLVSEAERRARTSLEEAQQSYLVFLLLRYLRRPDLVRTVLALRFLRGLMSGGRLRRERLQEVGDQCLIYAGLFPDQAERRRVRLSYFTDLGRSAYATLGGSAGPAAAEFAALAERFPALADVLRAVRLLDGQALEPLRAAEAWAAGGSRLGWEELRRQTGSIPARPDSDRLH